MTETALHLPTGRIAWRKDRRVRLVMSCPCGICWGVDADPGHVESEIERQAEKHREAVA